MRVFGLVCCGAALLIGGCATQKQKKLDVATLSTDDRAYYLNVVQEDLDREQRIKSIAMPMLVASRDLCKDDLGVYTGMEVWSSLNLPDRRYSEILIDEHKLDLNLRVKSVYENSPAALAGVKLGDQLVSIADMKLHPRKIEGKDYTRFDYMQTPPLEDWKDEGSYQLTVSRPSADGVYEEKKLTLNYQERCEYRVNYLFNKLTANASEDSDGFTFTSGLDYYLETDEHVALMVAHEIAHMIEGHPGDRKASGLAAGAGGLVAETLLGLLVGHTNGDITRAAYESGARANMDEHEMEADALAMVIYARSGYDPETMVTFWQNVSENLGTNGSSIGASHRVNEQRLAALKDLAGDLRRKIDNGVDLVEGTE
ncbi:M48 family metalloprotease [Kiloniella sp.]|uniref:M48 family metalloprotease n=1 Tax=Kiloniella sp. TaxID=1938587 RepID=UPI003A8D36A9